MGGFADNYKNYFHLVLTFSLDGDIILTNIFTHKNSEKEVLNYERKSNIPIEHTLGQRVV